ncbi:Two-component system sensor histidine kinase QseC [Georgfuchsia toluolica]|uniref:histidine kinase n=1 Tax=Georgfuchsia toluolica TaxID=424218 RepID=A0A916J580_9PROT|nr:ATP-binding protein [Georgfuchsia toluolica]CAG4884916.1 Two-component system sensor histidine kinase QseC [Georgfuchsia toluolica]
MKNSLRLRLLAGTLVIVAAIWTTMTIFAWIETRHEADELFDAHLAQTAALLAATVGDDADEIVEHLPTHRYTRHVAFQIWDKDRRLLAHSSSAPEQPLSVIEEGFSDTAQWRVYSTLTEDRRYLVQVGETHQARGSVSRELATHLLLPLGLALPLLALALVVLIRISFAPLSALAESIGQRSPERLDPIPVAGAPRELHPILGQLNRLLERVSRSLQQERNFTGDAAHELRTPLAAMRAHAQVARASHDEAERKRSLDSVIAAIDRATHLTEQLLVLARLDATTTAVAKTPYDLRAIAADALALTTPAAIAKRIDLELGEGPPLVANVEPALVVTLLRNLIDNAVRYSPAGSRVTAAVSQAGGEARIEIVDQGPGIPAGELARVRDRFYRVAGSNETGSGLGLSIASRIAQLHGGRLELDNIGDGLGQRVTVALPVTARRIEAA